MCYSMRSFAKRPHWDFSILIARLIIYYKKVEIDKTEFKQGKNNEIQ